MSHSQLPHQSHLHKSEWAKLVTSFTYAFSGLWYAFRTQRNIRIHIVMAMTVIMVSTMLHISPVEFALIFIAITGVFVAEMFNTVLEVCVDLASPRYHPLAKIAKDVAAGAVLANALLSIIIGLFVLGPYLLKFMGYP
jgi:diacylglycerol kinase